MWQPKRYTHYGNFILNNSAQWFNQLHLISSKPPHGGELDKRVLYLFLDAADSINIKD